MAFEFLAGLLDLHPAVIFVIFVVFVIIAYQVFKAVMKIALIAIVGALFPLAAPFIGLDVPLSLSSSLWFAILAVALYIGYALLKIAAAPVRWALGGKK